MNMLPTTKLEAVNDMLSGIGEAPITSLTAGYVEGDIALNILDSISREVQSSGWNFNTERKFSVAPDLNSNLVLPSNALKADGEKQTLDEHWIMRDGKLYNKAKQTFTWTVPVEITLVRGLDFDELPEAARRFITLKAGRQFQDRTMGIKVQHDASREDEHRAWIELQDFDADVQDFNIFDNFDTYQIVNRTGGRVR
jgi:hypothetical protein